MDQESDARFFGWGRWHVPGWLGRRSTRAMGLGRRTARDRDPEWRIRKCEATLARQIRLFGPDGGPTTNARMHLAIELERSDRLAEARVLWEKVLDASSRHRGPESSDVLTAEELLAINLVKSGMTDDARPLFAHVRDARERLLGSDHADTLRPTRWLSACERPAQSP